MNVVSLFDGISCARIALERAGIKVDRFYASEVDKYAIAITQRNYPDTIQVGDVTQLKGEDFKDIDLIIGGSPCTDLSICKKNRQGLKGDESKLFYEDVRLLREIKPKWFVLENVASMTNKNKNIITGILTDIYVDTTCIMINASLVSAQNRERYLWSNIPGITQPIDKGILLKDILEDGVVDRDKSLCIKSSYARYNGSQKYLRSRYFDKGTDQAVYIDDKNSIIRKLTCVECERLQCVPDGYTAFGIMNGKEVPISNSQRYKCLGNGFNVDVVSHILSFINKIPKFRVSKLDMW